MNISVKFICLLLCLATVQVLAQQRTISVSRFTLKAAKNEPIPDSIQVAFYKGIINGSYRNRENLKIKKNRDGSFNFSISTYQPIAPFEIWIYYSKDGQKQIFNTPKFYAEQADQIEIKVAKKDQLNAIKVNGVVSFNGKANLKYKVAMILRQMRTQLHEQEKKNIDNVFGGISNASNGKIESESYYLSPDFYKQLRSLLTNTKIGMNKNLDTLAKYEKQLGKEVTAYYRNLFVTPFNFIAFSHYLYSRARTEKTKEAISDFYFSNINSLRTEIPTETSFGFGIEYTWEKGLEVMYETDYQTKGRGFKLETQYDNIKSITNTELRDILITRFFEESGSFQRYINDSETRDSCLTDALRFVKQPELKGALQYQLMFVKGSKLPDFSFPDTSGKLVNLKDLKGKVFILDFYFEGCSSCAVFAKRFEKDIFPKLANNSDFKVLNVNTDLTRERWIRAIKSGAYTHPMSINLSIGKEGYNHPMLKHYGINAFPWVLLVDKEGNVITFKVIDLSTQNILKLIEDALNNNHSRSK